MELERKERSGLAVRAEKNGGARMRGSDRRGRSPRRGAEEEAGKGQLHIIGIRGM